MISNNAFSYHKISEVLTSNKIVICKNFYENIIGNKLEVMHEVHAKLPVKKYYKKSESELPNVGQLVNLYQQKVFSSQGRNRKTVFTNELIGNATISNESIIGDKYFITELQHDRRMKILTKEIVINKEGATKIKEACLVAIPNIELKNRDHILVDL
jgi:hypothetical protein